MIIYGWGYFNRREHSLVRGGCPSCGRQGYLKSYTSSKFFTLYFIPILPLGTQKIVSECPHCKQALGMPLRKWRKLRATDLPRAIADYETRPADEAAAKQALGIIFTLQDRAALRRIGPQIRTTFANNADVMTHLAGTYSYLCLDKEADAAYLDAVALSTDEKIATEANAHIELQKLPKPAAPNRLLQSLPVLIVPAALLFAATFYLQKATSAGVDRAWLLSGLDRSYDVVINGETVTLEPFQRVRADMIVYGRNEIAPTASSSLISSQTFSLEHPWYRRPFGGPLVVVNPDKAAVLLWERSGYGKTAVPDDAYSFKLATGMVSHVYAGIDFAFQEFPRTIEGRNDGYLVYRYRVSDIGRKEPQEMVQLLVSSGTHENARDYLRARLHAGAADRMTIWLGVAFLPREETLAFVKPHLATRPVNVEWHRAYQHLVDGTPEGDGLEAHYRALLDQDPNNSTLTYLLSRLLEDPPARREMLERAATLPQPTAYAANGLAWYHALEGDFATALRYCDEALRLKPADEQFASLRVSVRYGLRQFAAVEAEARNPLTSPPDYNGFYHHAYRLAKMGREAVARMDIQRYFDKLEKETGPVAPADRTRAVASLETAIAVATHDRPGFVLAASRINEPAWSFQQAIIEGKLEAAIRIATDAPEAAGLLGNLTLYILLAKASRGEQAAVHLEKAIAELAAGSREQRLWASWLKDEFPPDLRLAAHACSSIDEHFIYLAALAQKFPERASDYLARAAAIRTMDSFYSLALQDVLAPPTP